MGVVKRSDRFFPVFLCHLQKPQKGVIFQLLSTSRFNLFGSGYQLKEIVGFAVAKEKKGKRKILLIGSIEENDLYTMEKDVLQKIDEGKRKEGKKDEKSEIDKLSSGQDFAAEGLNFKEHTPEDNLNTNSECEKEKAILDAGNTHLEDLKIEADERTLSVSNNLNLECIPEERKSLPEIFEDNEKEIKKIENEREKEGGIEEVDKMEDTLPDLEKNYCILKFGEKRVWKRIFEDLKEACEKFEPFSDDKVKWVKVDKKNILRLSNLHPFLYVISNPFVFKLVSDQGYLVIGYKRSKKKKDRIEILVPGEYSEDAEKKAKAFGFSEFVTKDGKVIEGKEGYFKMTLELIEKEE
ncbi:V-type ATP synthase subunit I domain-containing protein [Caldicellulosiruptor naganoensis]|uniref:Uncharacterized protein n=1 Tax=Caldicellulosiruptor naganoensis TaxID=29324 RepID=A0ABY7BFW9_9FIRM|nr:hypothetical protein [Caldicellulosiruptor naganoensis]WAM31370.1 hypothetical protein OTJ99_002227 [Caldicellulosiruptor naganoensis]